MADDGLRARALLGPGQALPRSREDAGHLAVVLLLPRLCHRTYDGDIEARVAIGLAHVGLELLEAAAFGELEDLVLPREGGSRGRRVSEDGEDLHVVGLPAGHDGDVVDGHDPPGDILGVVDAVTHLELEDGETAGADDLALRIALGVGAAGGQRHNDGKSDDSKARTPVLPHVDPLDEGAILGWRRRVGKAKPTPTKSRRETVPAGGRQSRRDSGGRGQGRGGGDLRPRYPYEQEGSFCASNANLLARAARHPADS